MSELGIENLWRQLTSLGMLMLALGAVVWFWGLIEESKQLEHFEKAIRNLILSKTKIDPRTIINLYLGVREKTRDSLSKKDWKNLENG